MRRNRNPIVHRAALCTGAAPVLALRVLTELSRSGRPAVPDATVLPLGCSRGLPPIETAIESFSSSAGVISTNRRIPVGPKRFYGVESIDESGGIREDGLLIVRAEGRLRMRRRVCSIAAAAAFTGIIFAPPALAHQGHASCGEGARVYVVPQAQAGTAGETVSAAARAGTVNEGVAAAHAIFCEAK